MSEKFETQLPESWESAQLCEITTLIRGVSYKKEHSQNSPQDNFVPILRATNITGSSLTFEELVYVPARYVSELQTLSEGDIVIAASSGSKEIVGKAGQFMRLGWKGSFGAFCNVIRSDIELNSRYIGYYFQTRDYREAISEGSAGSNINNIKSSDLAAHRIPIAPRQEQTRIVAKLEELLSDLDAGVAELKAAQKKLVQYRQSLLKAAVEGKLTRHWREQHCAPSPQPLSHQGRGALGVDGVNDAAANYRPHLSGQNATLREQPPEFSNPPPSATLPSPLVGEGPGEREREALETGAQLLARILKQRRANWEAKQLAKFQQQGKAPPKGWQDKYPEPVKPDTGDLPELPEGWVWATLSQVGWLDRGKSQHRPRNAPHLYGGPYPFVQTGDIRHSDTFISGVEATYSEAGLAQSKLWPAGTMCITIAANIGKTAILRMEACFPDSVVGFLSGTNEVSIRYIEYFMRSVQQKLEDEAPATAQKNINLEILGKVVLPLPPIREQEYIVECLDGLLNAAAEKNHSIDLALKQSTAQRQNILRAAFSGQLVPQNPNDEPASVLLERIRAERAARQAAKAPKKRSTKTAS